MNTKSLVYRFKLVANQNADIDTFFFDELSTINYTQRNKAYNVMLMKPPQSVMTPFHKRDNEPIYENYNIEFFLFTPWKKTDKPVKPLEQVWTNIEAVGDRYLKDLLNYNENNTYSLIGDKSVTKDRGHHQHTGQLIGVKYSFTLRVYRDICYNLGQPTDFTATAISANRIDLSWTDNASGETGYEVWRSLNGRDYQLLTTEAAESTNYSDTGLSNGTVYYYKVRAIDAVGAGVFSYMVAEKTSGS